MNTQETMTDLEMEIMEIVLANPEGLTDDEIVAAVKRKRRQTIHDVVLSLAKVVEREEATNEDHK